MSCTILRPDPQALFNQLRDSFSATVLGGGQVVPESNEWYVVANDYAVAEQFYAIADQMWRERNPATACCDNLYIMAAQDGVFPRAAGYAEGYIKLTGTPDTLLPGSIEVTTELGTYVSIGTMPLSIGADGTAVVRVRALVPGPEMNSPGSTPTATVSAPPVGVDAEATVCGGQFCGGSEDEECEAFRQRYINRLAYQPKATQAWIKAKILEFPCATRVCVREGACCRCSAECNECGCTNCGNRMEFYVLFDGAFPCGIPPEHIINDLSTWLFGEHQGYGEGQVEIGVCGKLYAPIPLPVDLFIDIEGCPTVAQKQMITDGIVAVFGTICPSIPLRSRQIEMIAATVLGANINVSARFELVGGPDREKAYIAPCGDLEPECDYLPCLNSVNYTPPDSMRPVC